MKVKKIPYRTCVVTKEKFPKNELLRIVRTPLGEICIDDTGKMNGHGAYIKKDVEVLKIAKSKNILSRALEQEIPDEVYSTIESVIKGE